MGTVQSKADLATAAFVVLGLAVQSGVVWVGASFYYKTTPQLAVFDADKSVERFVVWSSDRVADDQFDSVLESFGRDVEMQLDAWSIATGTPVVQRGCVIAKADVSVVDWTEVVVQEVLQ